eukprot:CAMPEP_0197193276 /NCGR_PEP_ID=MMETSP1423-20130617/26832_1 /TAXON_ID=476441 /ORGANISM="Pseudo-nitzschia heimii, Strain UNC1101" /LENGTH=134 /DNA_ID=CAMNT_0042646417 /DNA_START=569 /DNA_END=969 /DNA_ORIENTATION=-
MHADSFRSLATSIVQFSLFPDSGLLFGRHQPFPAFGFGHVHDGVLVVLAVVRQDQLFQPGVVGVVEGLHLRARRRGVLHEVRFEDRPVEGAPAFPTELLEGADASQELVAIFLEGFHVTDEVDELPGLGIDSLR